MSSLIKPLSYSVCMEEITFGEWLQDQYMRAGLKQKEFAALIGVSNKTVSGWVNGVSTPRDLIVYEEIARVLGLDLNEVRRRAGRHEVQVDRRASWNVEAHASQGQTANVDDDRVTVYTHVQNDPDLTDHEKRFILDALDRARRRRREIEAFERERGGNG